MAPTPCGPAPGPAAGVLGARFSYWKAVEVVGITGSIVVLGEVVTALMAAA